MVLVRFWGLVAERPVPALLRLARAAGQRALVAAELVPVTERAAPVSAPVVVPVALRREAPVWAAGQPAPLVERWRALAVLRQQQLALVAVESARRAQDWLPVSADSVPAAGRLVSRLGWEPELRRERRKQSARHR